MANDQSWSSVLEQYAPFLANNAGLILISSVVALTFYAVVKKLDQGEGQGRGLVQTTVGNGRAHIIEDREGYVSGNVWSQTGLGPVANEPDYLGDEELFTAKFVPLKPMPVYTEDEMKRRSREFYEHMNRRRTVRMFSDRPVPREVIENIILTAGTSPSGAHMEPWTFVIVSDPELKSEIRHITETEEKINYERRMGDRWVADLRQLNVDWNKPYLETAPYLILVFVQVYGLRSDGRRQPHYYHQISVSLSAGLLIAAIHNAGLVTVTSTPMNAGSQFQALLDRPPNEKFMMLLPVGFPADDTEVPDLHRKPLRDISVWKAAQ